MITICVCILMHACIYICVCICECMYVGRQVCSMYVHVYVCRCGTSGAHTTCCEERPILLRVPSPALGALLTWLTVPAQCTGILALPGARDRLAAARESAFVCMYISTYMCVCVYAGASEWVWPCGHGRTNILTKRCMSILYSLHLIQILWWSLSYSGS